jgi:diketogulonate reductase-like aldo/keto reductase
MSSSSKTYNPATVDWNHISLGTWQNRGEACSVAVESALKLGYKRIDTATIYGNEQDVAEGIRRAGVPREQLHITSKLQPADMESAEAAYNAVKLSLKNLNTNYIDCVRRQTNR